MNEQWPIIVNSNMIVYKISCLIKEIIWLNLWSITKQNISYGSIQFQRLLNDASSCSLFARSANPHHLHTTSFTYHQLLQLSQITLHQLLEPFVRCLPNNYIHPTLHEMVNNFNLLNYILDKYLALLKPNWFLAEYKDRYWETAVWGVSSDVYFKVVELRS